MNADEFASEHNGITLAEVDGYHGISVDEKLLRIETAVAAMDERVTTLLDFAFMLVKSLQNAKDSAPGFMKGMLPDIPDLNHKR